MFCGLVVVLTLVVFISPVAAEPAVTIDGDRLVAIGNDIVLTCRFNASLPAFGVQWAKNRTLIARNDSRVTIRTNNNESQLNITDTTSRDAGNYTCSLGNHSAMANIVMQGGKSNTTAAPNTTGSTGGNSNITAAPNTTGSTGRTTPGSTPSEIPATTPTDTPATNPTDTPTTNPTEMTCFKVAVILNISWEFELLNTVSEKYKKLKKRFSTALKALFSNLTKDGDVEVSEVTLTKKDEKVLGKAKNSLVFKGNDEDFIEGVFRDQVKKGNLSENLPVIKDSAEFETVGVSFTDWKAKDGECEKCGDKGAAGPFEIMGTCKSGTCSCDGLKPNTTTSEDCLEYCPSSAAAITVSSLILAIGILLSFSFP